MESSLVFICINCVIFILPMLKSITGYLSKQEITYIIIVFLIYSSVFPTLKELGVTIGIAYFSFSIYLFYMLLGYWVRQSKIKIPKVLSILGFIGTGLYFVILAYVSDVKDYKFRRFFILILLWWLYCKQF